MATLSESKAEKGKIVSIEGDADTHRRLVDMGLLGAEYAVVSSKKHAKLASFGDFTAAIAKNIASMLEVDERL